MISDKELASKMVIYTENKKILKGQLPNLDKDFYETGISTDDEKYLEIV